MDMRVIRRVAKKEIGNYKSEMRVDKDMYYFAADKGGGYIVSLDTWSDLVEICCKRVPVRNPATKKIEILGIIDANKGYLKLIWLHPEILKTFKNIVNADKTYRQMSFKEYKDLALTRAEETLKKVDAMFLAKHPKKVG